MPNINAGTISAYAPVSVAVGTISVQVIAANVSRAGLIITNTSTGSIWLGFSGLAATLNGGIFLGASGGVFSMDDYTFNKDAVTAIAHAASSNLAIQEFYVI